MADEVFGRAFEKSLRVIQKGDRGDRVCSTCPAHVENVDTRLGIRCSEQSDISYRLSGRG